MDDGISALPEHLQHEVFSRVGDVKALFRFAATCRGWLRRFTDRAFLRELYPGSSSSHGHHRARLLGVFLQDKHVLQWDRSWAASAACLAPVFLPALGSPLGPAGRALASFVGGGGDDDDDGTFDYAQLLAARRGIVLVLLAARTPEEKRCHRFGVCNPVTGDRHVLPPLEWSLAGKRVNGYAIITAADSHGGSDHPPAAAAAARWTFSQLLVITQDGDRPRSTSEDYPAHLYSYSAATRSWSAPTACLNTRVFSLVGARSAVVHRGAAHWLCVDDGLAPWERAARGDDGDDHRLYRLSVDVATAAARVSLTRLPVRIGGKPFLCVSSDDKLVVASLYPVHVTVWTPPGAGDDDDTTPASAAARWPRASFRIPAAANYHQERWFSFDHGSLLVLFRGSGGVSVFILDLDTKVMEEVSILAFDNKASFVTASGASGGGKNLNFVTSVPYEMDLVELFMLQLGGIRERLGATTTSETESP